MSPIAPCPPPAAEGFHSKYVYPDLPEHASSRRQGSHTRQSLVPVQQLLPPVARELNMRVRGKPEKFDDGVPTGVLETRGYDRVRWDPDGECTGTREGPLPQPLEEDVRSMARRHRTARGRNGRTADSDHITTSLEREALRTRDVDQSGARGSVAPAVDEEAKHNADASDSRPLGRRSEGEASMHNATSEFRASTKTLGLTNEEKRL